ncbi:NAD-dependent epimerase/dehydratase family protein [Prosthecomicrobium sp. N25]|uniref:NAD-dependent epimerase/dehydratase family protein n=1 Tax=Prosthecomicrobium sp. N25 TaxID=3129254 RepID=UPI0030789606
MPRRVIMTGATGYVGGRLAARLVASGLAVCAVMRAGSDPARLTGCLPGLAVASADTPAALAEAISRFRPEVLLHVAAAGPFPPGPESAQRIVEANIGFAIAVVEASLAAGCEALVYTGTQWQHRTGTADYAPVDLYAASKQAFHDLMRAYTDHRGLKAIQLELCDVYGPSDPRRRIIDLLIEAALSGGPVDLTEGTQEIDPVHVDDVVSAYVAAAASAITSGTAPAATYSVCGGRPMSVRALARLVEEVTGRRIDARWGARTYAPGSLVRPYIHDRPLPGWSPKVRLEDGIAGMVAAVRQGAWA